MRSAFVTIVVVAFTVLASSAGCENNSPAPGEACSSVGGVCVSSTTGCSTESLPYPCASGEVCCGPTEAGAGGG